MAQDIAGTLDRAARTPPTNLAEVHRDVAAHRDRLMAHDRAIHEPSRPLGRQRVRSSGPVAGAGPPRGRFPADRPRRCRAPQPTPSRPRRAIYRSMRIWVASSDGAVGVWSGAPIMTSEQAQLALGLVGRLRDHTVPTAAQRLSAVIGETGLTEPQNVADWNPRVPAPRQRCGGCSSTSHRRSSTRSSPAWSRPRRAAPGAKQHHVSTRLGAHDATAKQARTFWLTGKASTAELHTRLIAAHALQAEWRRLSTDGGPLVYRGNVADAHSAYDKLCDELRALAHTCPQRTAGESRRRQRALSAFGRHWSPISPRSALLPRRNTLEERLHAAGLGPLLTQCRALRVGPRDLDEVLEAVWLRSMLDHLALTDAAYGSFQGATQNRVVDAYHRADTRAHQDDTGTSSASLCRAVVRRARPSSRTGEADPGRG